MFYDLSIQKFSFCDISNDISGVYLGCLPKILRDWDGNAPKIKDIPAWMKVPKDLQDPQLFPIQMHLLEGVCGLQGSQTSHSEQVSKLQLKALKSSNFTKVIVYDSKLYKDQTKWMLQSMIDRQRLQKDRGIQT
ncbi:developmental pluripotency-associated 5 protein [Perognathus longimembris pacificus]|uniref:developmental pluripotency-associated 5 protein n=1 Tax=Perognathus longimembris pacificus TaxID=214514 RepID=UPI00201A22DD|nr:developmental pluripotency-associated 5 protein [Perognathus longimembris pacificus]